MAISKPFDPLVRPQIAASLPMGLVRIFKGKHDLRIGAKMPSEKRWFSG